jgi:hypothetical protein
VRRRHSSNFGETPDVQAIVYHSSTITPNTIPLTPPIFPPLPVRRERVGVRVLTCVSPKFQVTQIPLAKRVARCAKSLNFFFAPSTENPQIPLRQPTKTPKITPIGRGGFFMVLNVFLFWVTLGGMGSGTPMPVLFLFPQENVNRPQKSQLPRPPKLMLHQYAPKFTKFTLSTSLYPLRHHPLLNTPCFIPVIPRAWVSPWRRNPVTYSTSDASKRAFS